MICAVRGACVLELGVIADDLTGAVKLASLLEAQGVRCPLVTSAEALRDIGGDVQAVAVGRKLLALPAAEAVADAEYAARALLAKGARQLYYKYSALFTSTARGNIGPVTEALMVLSNADRVLFCPARPARNATVYQGRLFLGRQMLHETPRRRDPVTPMTNSNLVEVLQSQSRVKVGLLDHRTLRQGTAASKRLLTEEGAAGVRFFIVDAIDPADLERIAALAGDARLVTGSDDLPVALAKSWATAMHQPRALPTPPPGPAVVFAGSCTPKTGRQLARFEETHPVCRIDLTQTAHDIEDRIVRWAEARLGAGPVAVATTTDAHGVERAHAALGRQVASALAEAILGGVARRLHARGVRKFVIAGGETSGAVMAALGVDRAGVGPYDELEGGFCRAAGEDPVWLVLKAGAAGGEDFLELALARLQAGPFGA